MLLVGGFGLQTLILGYNLSIRTLPLWGRWRRHWGYSPGPSLRYISRQYGATVLKRWGHLLCRSLSFAAASCRCAGDHVGHGWPLAVQHVWLGFAYLSSHCSAMRRLPSCFCAGVMYLIQERQLKSKRPGAWYHYLPSLALLDEAERQGATAGFPFLDLKASSRVQYGPNTPMQVVSALESDVATAPPGVVHVMLLLLGGSADVRLARHQAQPGRRWAGLLSSWRRILCIPRECL